jgi:hypothetical protein
LLSGNNDTESVASCKFISFARRDFTLTRQIGATLFLAAIYVCFVVRAASTLRLRERIVLVRYCANIDGLLLLFAFPIQWTFRLPREFSKSFIFHTLLCLIYICATLNNFNSLFSFLSHNNSNLQRAFTVESYLEQVSRAVEEALATTPMLKPIVRLITCAMSKVGSSATSAQMRRSSNNECSFAIIGTWSIADHQRPTTVLID